MDRENQHRMPAIAEGLCFALCKAICEIFNFRLHHKEKEQQSNWMISTN